MDFIMNYKSIKNGFKLLTIGVMISSIVGCSTSPKPAYVYKEELKEMPSTKNLKEGVMTAVRDDGAITEMSVDSSKRIYLIKKKSPMYTSSECEKYLEEDYKNIKKVLKSNGGELTDVVVNEKKKQSYNQNFIVDVENCYQTTNPDEYQYILNVKPKNIDEYNNTKPEAKEKNNDTFSKVNEGLSMIGYIVLFPIMAVFAVVFMVIVTPIFIYYVVVGHPGI